MTMKHRVVIEQTYTMQRSIVIEVDAEDMESAVEQVRADDSAAPDFDDPRWLVSYDLREEEVNAAA
jgi:hypothetical protein